MSKSTVLSSSARRALIISLIQNSVIESQAHLVEELSRNGVQVTQATASRDLDEIGVMRGRDENGVMRYQLTPSSTPTTKAFSELILSIESSGNIAVVRTPPGGAALLASTLDRASISGALTSVIGTIAGDDTVLVISRSATGGAGLAKELTKFSRPQAIKSAKSSTPKRRK
jgi:transcriptional regulator of arginine metabolism